MKTSRFAVATAAAAGLALLLTACGGPHAGEVHDKNHADGYYSPVQTCAMYDKNGNCSFYTQTQVWNPPTWSLDMYNGDEHGWVIVTEARYDSVEIGDYVNLDE